MKSNKFVSFFKKYSTILVCALVIPSLISIGQYFFTFSNEYHNEYYQGEVLDIDGVTGGFNFQAAWTTAYTVASAIKKR